MTDLCADDVVVCLSGSQLISSETIVSACDGGGRNSSGGGSGGGASGELGRRLLVAARAGDTSAVLDLMARGAPFTTDWLGTSPLHLAASNAHIDTCAVLLRAGVSRDARTKVERTPLHLAAHAGHAGVAALLLEHGALVDCRDMLGMSPLHWAVERGHTEVVCVLLQHGADPTLMSKFHKSPLSIAAALRRDDMLKLIEDALKDREAAKSVHALVNEQMTEIAAAEPQLQTFETVQKLQDYTPLKKSKPIRQHEKIKSTTPTEGREETVPEGAAAQLLRKHGITLLPADDTPTVLNALHSGRTVVLSDAGKLMLKESSSGPKAGVAKMSAGGLIGGQEKERSGVVLRATPVRSPPRGVKVFTLNNKLLLDHNLNLNNIINPQDLPVKLLQLPADTKIISPTKAIPMKAKAKLISRQSNVTSSPSLTVVSGAPSTLSAVNAATPTISAISTSTGRPAVKIIMNKSNFNKLMANATNTNVLHNGLIEVNTSNSSPTTIPEASEADTENILNVTEDYLQRCSVRTLRAHSIAAHRALGTLQKRLNEYTTRLSRYENVD